LDIAGYTWDGYNTDWVNSSKATATTTGNEAKVSVLQNTSVYNKNLNAAMKNVSIDVSTSAVSGTLGYTSNYSGYTSQLPSSAKNISVSTYANGKYGYGHFITFQIYAPVTDYTSSGTIEFVSGTDRRTISCSGMSNQRINVACRITPETKSIAFVCDWDGSGSKYQPCTTVMDLSALSFTNRSGVDAIREVALAYDRRGEWIQYETFSMSYASNLKGLDTLRISTSAIPEMATSNNTLYLDCAGFINAAYINSIGTAAGDQESIDIVVDPTNRMYFYEVTHSETDAKKAAILADFEAILQPGDLIAYAYCDENGTDTGDGHTMIYLGDGMMIHCEGSVYIDGVRHTSTTGKPYDTEEVSGAISYESIYDTLLNVDHTRYLFSLKSRFAIVRPLDSNETVTAQAEKRLSVLPGVVIEKISSHPYGKTAARGENITITYNITNTASTGCSFTLESALPSGTTLVSGSLTQVIALSAGESKTVSFTVQVNNGTAYGTKLSFTSAAGNMTLNTCTVTVGKALSGTSISKMSSLISSGYTFTSKNSFDLMKEVYSQCGATLNIGSAVSVYDLWNDVFTYSGTSYITMVSGSSNAGQKMLAPSLYGGCRLYDATGETIRVKKLTTESLMVGDVIVFSSNPGATLSGISYNLYIYLGNDTFVTYDGGVKTFTANGIDRSAHWANGTEKFLDDEVAQLFGSSAFAVLRPSLY